MAALTRRRIREQGLLPWFAFLGRRAFLFMNRTLWVTGPLLGAVTTGLSADNMPKRLLEFPTRVPRVKSECIGRTLTLLTALTLVLATFGCLKSVVSKRTWAGRPAPTMRLPAQ